MHILCTIAALHMFSWFAEATGCGIVGGKVSKPHSKPYMASLQVQGEHVCGGILIREDFVLTAGHCKVDQTMTVVLGAHDITKKEKSQQHIQVAEYHPHPKYRGKYQYDIMLLKLKPKATLNRYVKPMGLPKKAGKTPANIRCMVAGWGQTSKKSKMSPVLMETTEKIQFSFECKKIWQYHFESDLMTCTKPDKWGGVCQGDSGGPLIYNTKPVGITVFTYKNDCSDRRYPHVFMKIHPFLPWIKEVMEENVVV
ncbi:granzyme B(G,H)-like [Nerophis ophidion]|uniref:granzyme B(G,H)-like n=1 Tax=Nerophis ophidion TaxID=159077 RepID=UPI002ADF8266|nr:granzyme B(G,H)-like [Nerophis ophidion]